MVNLMNSSPSLNIHLLSFTCLILEASNTMPSSTNTNNASAKSPQPNEARNVTSSTAVHVVNEPALSPATSDVAEEAPEARQGSAANIARKFKQAFSKFRWSCLKSKADPVIHKNESSELTAAGSSSLARSERNNSLARGVQAADRAGTFPLEPIRTTSGPAVPTNSITNADGRLFTVEAVATKMIAQSKRGSLENALPSQC